MNMKKAAALLLSLALAAGIVSAAAPRAKAADAAPYSSMQFYRNELTSYTGSAKQVVVPEGVETIGASAFQNNTALTSVSLPSTLKSIGAYAHFRAARQEQIPRQLRRILPDIRLRVGALRDVDEQRTTRVLRFFGVVPPGRILSSDTPYIVQIDHARGEGPVVF